MIRRIVFWTWSKNFTSGNHEFSHQFFGRVILGIFMLVVLLNRSLLPLLECISCIKLCLPFAFGCSEFLLGWLAQICEKLILLRAIFSFDGWLEKKRKKIETFRFDETKMSMGIKDGLASIFGVGWGQCLFCVVDRTSNAVKGWCWVEIHLFLKLKSIMALPWVYAGRYRPILRPPPSGPFQSFPFLIALLHLQVW